MNFKTGIDQLVSQISDIEKQNDKVVRNLLEKEFDEDFHLIKSYKFDSDLNKFTMIDAPVHITNKLAELNYYDL